MGFAWEEEGIGLPCSILTDTESDVRVPSLLKVSLAIIDSFDFGFF
jgi:hypothetical protein